MKKFLVLILCLSLFFSVFGCGSEPESDESLSSETVEPSETDSSEENTTEAYVEQQPLISDLQIYLNSASCAVIDDSGTLYLAKDAFAERAPASITKVLTALVTCEHAALDDVVTVRQEDIEKIDIMSSGVTPSLKPAEELTVRDLLYALILPSTNAAANVLATYVAGSIDKFVDMMNEKAEQLGLHHSHFNNPHGLDEPEHYTCAYDMAMILRAATKNSFLLPVISAKTYSIPATKYAVQRDVGMGHQMINGQWHCEGVYAGKTGSTLNAGKTLITAVERNGQKFYVCTMGSEEQYQYQDTDNLIRRVYGYVKNAQPTFLSFPDQVELLSEDKTGVNLKWKLENHATAAKAVYWKLGNTVSYEIAMEPKEEMTYHFNFPEKGAYVIQLFSANGNSITSNCTYNVLYTGEKKNEGIQNWNGQSYYINRKGFLEVSAIETKDGCYFANGDGAIGHGFVGGKYFAGEDGKIICGFFEHGGEKFYASADGRLVYGDCIIDGVLHHFNDYGAMTK